MAKQSLAAQSGAVAVPFTMPSVFSAPVEPVKARAISPYITFAHPKRSDEWAKLVAKFQHVAESDMFLIEPDNLTSLSNVKCTLLACRQYWAQSNASGQELISASWQEMPHPYKEHVEAVLLVYLDGRLVPANVLFRTTKCPAVQTLSVALADAVKPDWAERSPAHKETLVCNQPFMRFYGTVALGPTRTGKASGLPYRPTTCSIHPTTLVEWKLLKAFIDSEGAEKAMQSAADRFQSRINDVSAKVAV
jgi:hypothetical protein